MGKTFRLTFVALAVSTLVAACTGNDDGASVRTIGDCGSSSAPASGSGTGSDAAADPSGSGPAASDCPEQGSGSGVAAECQRVGDIDTADTVVDVSLDEWVIDPSVTSVPAGQVGFVVRNAGKEVHELVIVEGVEPAALPLDADGALDEDRLPPGALIGEVEGFPAGETCSGVFALRPGEYTLVCNITETEANGAVESHVHEGMVTTFTVT